MADQSTTEAVQILRDRSSIEALVRRYADICDEDYNPDKLAPLFTEDAVWSSTSQSGTSDFGVYTGRQGIYDFFAGVSQQIVHAHHIVMSPEIEIVEPKAHARGRWNTVVLMGLAEDPLREREDEAKMMTAVYTHQYRHEDGEWLIARLDVHTRFDLRVRIVG